MQYSEFIRKMKKYTTNVLQVTSAPSICTPTQVPRIFLHTFFNITAIINANAKEICTQPNQQIVIFSLQPVSIAVTSNLPKKLGRIINPKHPKNHLCCSLGYVLLNNNENFVSIHTHQQRNLFIDFTTGLIADINYYLNIFCQVKQLPENIYGTIDQILLKKIWSVFVKQQYGGNNNVRYYQKKTSYTRC